MQIPYSKQNIDYKDRIAVDNVLKSKLITQGAEIEKFENKINKFVGAKYTLTLNSGTSALHTACIGLNLNKNKILWTSAISFVASANCAIYCNADVDFLDIDNKTGLISLEFLEKKLFFAKRRNNLPSIVMPVHLSGQPCDMKEIWKLSKKYNFKIIEDASHALGAQYQKTKIGDCKYSHACVFSLHAVKTITTGEGGIITTNQKNLYEKMKMFKNHGITRDNNKLKSKLNRKYSWYYEQQTIGMNYRMTDFQAALGISQLKKINSFYIKRKKIFDYYKNFFKKNLKNIKYLKVKEDRTSSFHLFVVLFRTKKNRNLAFKELTNFGYKVNLHYIPIYRQPFYKKKKKYTKLPNSENYFNKALSLPLYPNLKIIDLKKLENILIKYD